MADLNKEGFEELETSPIDAYGKKLLLLRIPNEVI
jgi:hypothetical protein